jgi:transcriptional regulator with PAS, ATPase and Fis domain
MLNLVSQNYFHVLLLVNTRGAIDSIVGVPEDVFGHNLSHIIQPQLSLEQIEWDHFFMTCPNFELDNQILYTVNKHETLMSKTYIKNGEKIHYILSFTNLSKCSKLITNSSRSLNIHEKDDLITESEKMKKIINITQQIANVNSTVLLLGESGVGKTAIAKLIHKISNRKSDPFISINCGSLPENLIEAELFGYESGTFTGGKKGGKSGLFEIAHKGTIFLDEIAELPLNVQAKLLDVLQENQFRKVGGVKKQEIDVRVVAATNKDLSQLVRSKLFREDLFYRLNVIPIKLPPLRERKEDIPKLIDYFLYQFNTRYGLQVQIDDITKKQLLDHSWPGNIRELSNTIERFVVTNSNELFNSQIESAGAMSLKPHDDEIIPLKEAKRQLEKELVMKAYEKFGSTYKAAKALKVDQSTIAKKIKEYRDELEESL